MNGNSTAKRMSIQEHVVTWNSLAFKLLESICQNRSDLLPSKNNNVIVQVVRKPTPVHVNDAAASILLQHLDQSRGPVSGWSLPTMDDDREVAPSWTRLWRYLRPKRPLKCWTAKQNYSKRESSDLMSGQTWPCRRRSWRFRQTHRMKRRSRTKLRLWK